MMDVFSFQWQLRTKLVFGAGEFAGIGKYVSEFGKHALLVTGKHSLRKTGRLDVILQLLTESGVRVTVFDKIEENPRLETVEKGTGLAREEGCDVVLAVGGGSAMDAAKAIALELTTGCSAWDYIVMHKTKKIVPRLSIPLVLVPTMNATGSEMNGNAVITNTELCEKSPLSDSNLSADLAVIDPELTLTLPWTQTAYTLMDATSHALEVYLSAQRDVSISFGMTEVILKAIVEAGRQLIENPLDLSARSSLAWAGSIACSNLPSVGLQGERYCHHVEHVLSAYTDIAHALGLAIIIPHWMRMFKNEIEDLLLRIGSVYLDGQVPESADDAIEGFERWLESIGLKTSLSKQGVVDLGLPVKMAKSLFAIEPLAKKFSGGRVPMTEQQLVALYEACY